MVKSMTGYGLVVEDADDYKICIEIKTINSKSLDNSFKIPQVFNDLELDIKNIISSVIERGKVYLNLTYTEKQENIASLEIDQLSFRYYYEHFSEIAHLLGIESMNKQDLFSDVIRLPGVIKQKERPHLVKIPIPHVLQLIKTAALECDSYRAKEGEILGVKIQSYIQHISLTLMEINQRDGERIEAIKKKITNNLLEILELGSIDQKRLEQELVYYTEKLDITEEKVRLEAHIDFFPHRITS